MGISLLFRDSVLSGALAALVVVVVVVRILHDRVKLDSLRIRLLIVNHISRFIHIFRFLVLWHQILNLRSVTCVALLVILLISIRVSHLEWRVVAIRTLSPLVVDRLGFGQ